jgi:hypothetical protein
MTILNDQTVRTEFVGKRNYRRIFLSYSVSTKTLITY